MEGVRVHRDSPLPAEIGALAFAEGSTIQLGPGQEAHLAHEAWHVAQQSAAAWSRLRATCTGGRSTTIRCSSARPRRWARAPPHAYLTGGAGRQLLERELETLLRRSFPLSKTPDNVVANDKERTNWNEPADTMFFQGTAELLASDPPGDYTIEIQLKSIAPGRADLGYGLLPQDL